MQHSPMKPHDLTRISPASVLEMTGEELHEITLIGLSAYNDEPEKLLNLAHAFKQRAFTLGLKRLQLYGLSFCARLYEGMNKHEECAAEIQQMREVGQQLTVQSELCYFHSQIGTLEANRGDFAAAMKHLLSAVELYTEDSGEGVAYAQACHGITFTYNETGLYQESIRWALRLLDFLDRGGARSDTGALHCLVADAYKMSGDNTTARRYLEKARSIFRSTGLKLGEADVCYLDAQLHVADGNYAPALQAAEHAQQLFGEVNSVLQEYNSRLLRARVLRMSHRENEALELLEDWRPDQGIERTPRLETQRLHEMGRILRQMGRPQEALEYLLRVEAEFNSGVRKIDFLDLYDDLAEVYAELGDVRATRECSRKFRDMREEFHSLERLRAVARIEMQRKIRKAEHDARNLKAELQTTRENLQSHKAKLGELTIRLDRNQAEFDVVKQHIRKIAATSVGRRRHFAENLLDLIESSHDQRNEVDIAEVFDEVVADLANAYPALTTTELKICVFLRMALSTKEIADLTFKSVATIKTHRRNIRKKLNPGRQSLSAYLMQFGKPDHAAGKHQESKWAVPSP